MAAISKIRKNYVLLIIVIGVALLAFIIGDFGSSSRTQVSPVGVIKGKKISIQDFENRVNEVVEMNSQSMTPQQLADMNMRIRESVWEEMVAEVIQKEEYEKLGITITTDELNELIRGEKPHQYIVNNFTDQNTGQIDREKLESFLENLNDPQIVRPETRDIYLTIEKMIKKETLENKYSALLTNGYYYPAEFAKKNYNDKVDQYKVSYVAQNYKSIPDTTVSATEREYKEYYNKNKETYKTKETRDIIYIEKNILPSKEDHDDLVSRINQSFEEFKTAPNMAAFIASESEVPYGNMWKVKEELIPSLAEEIMDAKVGTFISPFEHDGKITYYKIEGNEMRPDSLKATHILIAYQGAASADPAITRTKQEAENRADSILKVLKRDTAQIENLALTMSDDGSAQNNQGRLGWFVDGNMVKEFNDYVLNNKKSSIGIVESVFGFHIVKVDDKTAPIHKVKLAEVTRTFTPSEETYRTEYMKMSSFASAVSSVEEFETKAKEEGISVRDQKGILKMADRLGAIKGSRQLVKWAFSKEADKTPVSNIYEFEGKLVFAAVKNKQDEGYMSFESVKSKITPLVLRDKKATIVAERLEKAKQASPSVEGIASQLGVQVETAIVHGNMTTLGKYGQEPAVVGAMLAAEENTLSEVVKGEQAAYVYTKKLENSLSEKTSFEDDQKRIARQATSKMNVRNIIKAIVKDTKVKDNRSLFY